MDVGKGLKITLVEQRAYVEYKYKEILLINVREQTDGLTGTLTDVLRDQLPK